MLRALVLLATLSLGCGSAGIPRVDPEKAQALLQRPGVLLLDVRTEAEHRERSIPGTDALIPVQELAARLKELEPYKQRPVLVYCRSGNRSLQAAKLLKESGFQDVTDLEGGILSWASKGYPTSSGTAVSQ